MTMNAIIVEDEPFLAQMLKKMIAEVQPDCKILTMVSGVKEAVDWFKNHPDPCIVFMDIQLSDGVCFDIFDALDLSNKGIVFTTAYDEYMLDAFEFNSISYLLKPIKKEALEKSFEKIGKLRGAIQQVSKTVSQNQTFQLAQLIRQLNPRSRQRFMIARADGYSQLPVAEIACFYVTEKIVNAYTFNGKVHVVDFSLEKLEEELDKNQFFRANRQFVLNIEAIDRLDNYFGGKLIVRLKGLIDIERIVVSRGKAGLLKRWMDK